MSTESHGSTGRVVVGCSGYHYPEWRGDFYPGDLPHDEWFCYYAEHFSGVEINNTFYNLPEASTIDSWRERAPEGFVYVLKLSRCGMHLKHLKDPDEWIGNFVGVARRLEDRLGPILMQLPPNWAPDLARLRGFLDAAPGDLQWAVEVRDERWLREEVYDALREADAALVIHDMIEDHPRVRTASWVYVRCHGASDERKYAGAYSHRALTAEAREFAGWVAEGDDVYAFFNNDVDAAAPGDAQRLERYLDSALEDRG